MAAGACVLLAGCFHQVVSTGLAAGTNRVERPWTSTWIFGLVEAKPIDVRQQCPDGAAFIESKMTFMNGLATLLTLGIWDPWTVTITCASGGRASLDPTTTTLELAPSDPGALDVAARIAWTTGRTVAVVWDVTSHGQAEDSR
jgi:hypothetical protein